MIYDTLAHYYDGLVKDEEATSMWVSFVEKYISQGKILELASGSGEITHALKDKGYDILASDFSDKMLEELHSKYPTVSTKVIDMREFHFEEKFDGILCFCDSINYLNSVKECESMFSCVYDALKEDGVFLFDMHTPDRLKEFEEPFIEEGYVRDIPYQWTIQSNEDTIYQHFAFYENGKVLQEQHTQTVFPLDAILNSMSRIGFTSEVYTDFIHEGVHEGEKYFIVGRKKK